MPYRRSILVTDQIYHVVNRTIASFPIFNQPKDFQRMIKVIDFYRFSNPVLCYSRFNNLSKEEKEKFLLSHQKNSQLVEIIAFCLMPNHIHFLLKQKMDKGISKFMSNIQNSYAKYFNIKNKRAGGVFQAMFKAIRIETDEQLLHVSRYIHLNPISSFLIEIDNLKEYYWSSFKNYFEINSRYDFVNPIQIFTFFKSKKEYVKFVFNQADYQRQLQKIKHLVLES